MVVWRKGNNVLTAGALKVVNDPRVGLLPSATSSSGSVYSSRLEVKDVNPGDAGDFVCQISVTGQDIIQLADPVEGQGEG